LIYRHQFPVVRVILPFMAGIAVVLITGIPQSISLQIIIALWLILFFYSLLAKRLWKFSTRWFFGLVTSVFMFMLGCQLTILHNELHYASHFSKIKGARVFIAKIAEPLTEKERSFKTVLKLKCAVTGDGEVYCTGKILAYLKKDSTANYPKYGQTILFSGNIGEISPPQNPGAFDYKRYMAASNIYHQIFLKPGQLQVTNAPVEWNLKAQAQDIRDYFLNILKKNGLSGQEYAVAAALILGQEDNLDAETMREYSGAGVMHILSVSGLHVGIVYMVLNFLLGFLNRNRTTIIIKTLLIIAIIWFYALITGFSPSVARSAAMFTIVLLAILVDRNSHIINSLAISALILLAYNPFYLLNIGFQLSYIAVAGIVFIYDWIYQRINPATWIGDKIWQIVAISLAAQIATIPISLFYFHQLPSYFLAANIVAIPLSSLVIYSGMLVLTTSFVPVISNFLGFVTAELLKLLNGSIAWIENLPYAVISGIPFRISEMLILYFALIMLMLAIAYRQKLALMMAMASLIVFFGIRTIYELNSQKQQKFIVYSANKNSVIEWIDGTEAYVLADSLFRSDPVRQDFVLKRSNTALGVKKTFFIELRANDDSVVHHAPAFVSSANNYLIKNTLVTVLNDIPKNVRSSHPLKVSYLILRGNITGSLMNIMQLYDPQCVILDGNVPYGKSLRWLTDGKQAGIQVYSVRQNGAFIADI